MGRSFVRCALFGALVLATATAAAQVRIGVTVSATGPAASLGIPERNTIPMCPKTAGGKSIEYIVLDDASDTTTAVQNTRKLMGESKVDALIGSTTTPNSLGMIDVFADGETPAISLASSVRIIEPVDAKKAWSFKTPQTDVMMAGAILEHASAHGVKTLGYIGFSDALGEAFFAEIDKAAKGRNIPLVANERFAPKDTSVVGQVLKLISARPDAIVIGASGTPAALPATTLVERGYKGRVYLNHGVANNDFLRVGGKDVEGMFVPASPVIVAGQLPDSHPAKKRALEYTALYESSYGAGSVSAFGSYTWDACLELANAIPAALKTAQPGTVEFRRALRDALEATRNLEVSNGVVNMSKTDHLGLDARARVMTRIENGKWTLQP
ncbi:MAG TPA: ABC transporter substrate-binding protein [Casimicrobiaceae bacterium]|jgi:branched-chain amino acid transport system substrate-binding protein|nr:ABC transporter substrate-binding protein [Casimicrobiaceae bacterium]